MKDSSKKEKKISVTDSISKTAAVLVDLNRQSLSTLHAMPIVNENVRNRYFENYLLNRKLVTSSHSSNSLSTNNSSVAANKTSNTNNTNNNNNNNNSVNNHNNNNNNSNSNNNTYYNNTFTNLFSSLSTIYFKPNFNLAEQQTTSLPTQSPFDHVELKDDDTTSKFLYSFSISCNK